MQRVYQNTCPRTTWNRPTSFFLSCFPFHQWAVRVVNDYTTLGTGGGKKLKDCCLFRELLVNSGVIKTLKIEL
jgi:hypothetical protein